MKTLKVLLINPSYRIGEARPLGEINLPTIPLGLGYIAAMLQQHGVSSRVLDMKVTKMSINDLKKSYGLCASPSWGDFDDI